MKKNITMIILLSFFGLSANFKGLNSGTRPLGMGNAFSAISGVPECVYFNPAGCADIEEYNLNTSYQNVYGISYLNNLNLAVSIPTRDFNTGIALQQSSLIDVYSENILYFNAAKKLEISGRNFLAGTNVKYYFTGGEESEVELDQPFDLDLGLIYKEGSSSLAYTAKNLLRIAEEKDHIYTTHVIAAALNWQDLLNVTADYDISEEESNMHLGIELWFYDTFAPRIGLDNEYLTMGFGLKSSWWNFDFALSTHEKLGNNYRFGFNLKYKRSSL